MKTEMIWAGLEIPKQMSYYKKGSIDRYLHTETLDYSIINENIKKRKIESEKYLSEALENI